MHLKLFVLSASSVFLWIAPLSALDRRPKGSLHGFNGYNGHLGQH